MTHHAHRPNGEWGRKARKQEDRDRGLNNHARREAIAEQTNDITQEEEDQ